MNAEDYFISLFHSRSEAIGDDGAVIGKMVYSKDAFFEDVHFKRAWMSLEQVAYRSMMVNLSDAVAMNATPRHALLSVAIPRSFTASQMRALHKGFQRAADQFGLQIIGGDTISNTKLDITVTIISTSTTPLLRTGLRYGDLVAHTGMLGRSRKELRYLLSGGTLHRGSKFVDLTLRQAFVRDVTTSLHSGMDISDGLFSDLEKLGRSNMVDFRLFRPLSRSIGCSGEEYEMLIGLSPRSRKRVIRLAKKNRTPLKFIGKAVRGKYRNRCKAHHF